MGMDGQERIYIGFTSAHVDGREDFVVFRYDTSTGERRFLGTFMDASQAAGNLMPAEEIPKGHTRMLEIDGRMYMGSQGFHDLKATIDTSPTTGDRICTHTILLAGNWKISAVHFPVAW